MEFFAGLGQLAAGSRAFARWSLAIGENRLELLMADIQEERQRCRYEGFDPAGSGNTPWLTHRCAALITPDISYETKQII